jgi:hypothetical protein
MMFAYIDPGFGTLLWQMIVAVFVGFLFYLKQTRQWIVGVIVSVFRKMFGGGGRNLRTLSRKFPPKKQ